MNWWLGVAAVGAPAGQAAPPLWNIAWITDTQTPACEWIAALTAKVAANRPRMVIHTGDTRFEWANQCAWREFMTLLNTASPPLEFHLAPGNHDSVNGVLKFHLRRAATAGIYPLDTGLRQEGQGHYHNRVTQDIAGPLWPVWNPEIHRHPAWQTNANRKPVDHRQPEPPYRYVFKRGGVRFIVCDCYFSEDLCRWVRDTITQPDDSSVSILLQHRHEVENLAKYFEGLEGRHNVKLVLSGEHHHFLREERQGVTFITGSGIARGPEGENDAMTLWVYRNRLQLDRYRLPQGQGLPAVEGPQTIWSCEGSFSDYDRPAYLVEPAGEAVVGAAENTAGPPAPAPGPNLLLNGDFDNHVWYERFRGWSPSGWYQWFTRGGHAPEHAVGKHSATGRPAHSGKEFVRIHMWAYAWRGGVLQVVSGLEPGRFYRLTAYGCFAPDNAPEPNARIGFDPRGGLADQFCVDVTRHPAPKYDEGVGDDPKTRAFDGPDLPATTVWSDTHDYYRWGKFEVTAEARSEKGTVILYCAPKQRPATQPIYEMNWDSVSLVEIPWPAPRLLDSDAVLETAPAIHDTVIRIQPSEKTAQVTWGTKVPAGAAQVLYRFLQAKPAADDPTPGNSKPVLRCGDFAFASPVRYARSAKRHWITLENFAVPSNAAGVEAVVLSRAIIEGTGKTLCSAPVFEVSGKTESSPR